MDISFITQARIVATTLAAPIEASTHFSFLKEAYGAFDFQKGFD
jgi:hypothetical protein